MQRGCDGRYPSFNRRLQLSRGGRREQDDRTCSFFTPKLRKCDLDARLAYQIIITGVDLGSYWMQAARIRGDDRPLLFSQVRLSALSPLELKVLATMLGHYPTNCAIFLDLDGTLIDIADTPDGVVVPTELVPLLTRLFVGLHGAIAIITGRPVSDVDRFLAPLRLVVAGVHGAELRTLPDGELHLTAGPLDSSIVDAVQELGGIAQGVIIEPKVCSIAVHYRRAPRAKARIEAALRRIVECRPGHLVLCPGRRVIEVVPKHISKGAALDALLRLPEFRGRRPVMIGDDVSDQSAFAAAIRLRGRGLRVAGEHFGSEACDFDGPAHVRVWLSALAERLEA
jgi:trehalose 6-phosphate phosphatase